MNFLLALWKLIREFFETQQSVYVPPVVPVVVPPVVVPVVVHSKAWCGGTYEERMEMYHLAKTVCVAEGIIGQDSLDMLATIFGESGYNRWCENQKTFDYGLCQFSKRYYLVEYKMTPQEAIDSPERCLRIMAKNWKTRKSNWVAYSSGGFRKWLGREPGSII